MDDPRSPSQPLERRQFIRAAAAGTAITALGATWIFAEDPTNAALAAAPRADGRPRLPPGQRVIEALKPMGGDQGDADPAHFRLKLHGEVERPTELDFAALRALPQQEHLMDVHCVTGWSAFDVRFRGVSLPELAQLVAVKPTARYVIFEAAHGYTANVPLKEAMRPDVLVTWEMNGARLPRSHGAPVRAVNPYLYFWKSPKWLTGLRFQSQDERGYWEMRGYNNHADPWKEERYA
jgi:DMSO/TMAO reductase YedYZ molybdopterin-dependent catalytic subunit